MQTDEFKTEVDALWARTKAGELPRQARFQAIEELTDRYVMARGESPPPAQLDRLSTLCLYEEVTDKHPDKMTRDSYAIMSDTQYERREEAEIKISDIQYGRDNAIGFRTVMYEDENGVMRKSRKRIYDFPK